MGCLTEGVEVMSMRDGTCYPSYATFLYVARSAFDPGAIIAALFGGALPRNCYYHHHHYYHYSACGTFKRITRAYPNSPLTHPLSNNLYCQKIKSARPLPTPIPVIPDAPHELQLLAPL
jgi:hypothetical protein